MLTTQEKEKACRIGAQVAKRRGHQVSGRALVAREPTEQCDVIVIVAPAGSGHTTSYVHVVLEIRHKDTGRFLHTLDIRRGSNLVDGFLECTACDNYHTSDIFYEYRAEDLEGHVCEGGSFWDDGDGKGGFTPCTRTDAEWYEFWMTGTAGWFCPSHWPYDDDMKAIKRARERAEHRKAQQT